MEHSNVVDITPENFQQIIIEQSKTKLIVIGFWTGREQACVDMMNEIEALVAPHPEAAIFAKIDVDTQAQIAMQFGVQSVPTTALFHDGKPVDSYVGMKLGAELEQFLAPHLPKEQDGLLTKAKALIGAGDHQSAFGLVKKAYEIDSERADIKLAMADTCINLGKVDDAEQLLQSIKMVDQDSYYQSLLSALQLAQSAADSPEIQALQAQLEQAPDDNEIKLKLAVQLSQVNRTEEALEMLFSVLKQDMAYGEAKKLFLDVLATCPDGDAIASTYRRKMYSLLY